MIEDPNRLDDPSRHVENRHAANHDRRDGDLGQGQGSDTIDVKAGPSQGTEVDDQGHGNGDEVLVVATDVPATDEKTSIE